MGLPFFLGSLFAAGMYPIYEPAEFVLILSLFKQVVSPLKDVEGLHFKFHYNLYHKYVLFLLLFILLTLSKKKYPFRRTKIPVGVSYANSNLNGQRGAAGWHGQVYYSLYSSRNRQMFRVCRNL